MVVDTIKHRGNFAMVACNLWKSLTGHHEHHKKHVFWGNRTDFLMTLFFRKNHCQTSIYYQYLFLMVLMVLMVELLKNQ